MSFSDFSSPWWLLFLVVVAALAVGYVLVQRRKQRHALRFSNLEMLEKVAPNRPGPARHIPVIALLSALALLTVALAGPTAEQRVPRNRATVVLVIDVSLSMEATDVAPNRLVAAQQAAKQFADDLTPGINLGLVAFSGTASVLVSPTTNREATKSAIDQLTLSERTATGEAIFTAMQSIDTLAAVLGGGDQAPPARIVLLSDGKQTVPESPDDPRGGFTAARQAADKGIPVSTISFGTEYGTVTIEDERIPVPVDDPSLKEIANLSGGAFFTASSLEELEDAYDTLEEQIGFETTRGDASRPWLVLGVLAAAVGLGAALVLRQRLP
ncbi:VWA domain-containing protein [Rhodococcus sp. NPDC003382]|uniref:VWA domain-containing protein n=1 Tax=unclassified Rhodococcus (in: high G+C Gram-positive bacteria) TaxID=192944 RepID=UPI0018CCC3BD|nr:MULTISPECIES: VWA domain-containing protein [unclassified Rhodococcus (in: high G+C Gram-positive bacteria)]MBH0121365.1 VWA domain-containing protein [Rhodococcus sp. CX]MCK8671310.1 VWA domain-containing protein [Rhodococcus sp. HM1]